eukprot:gene17867-biopygen840
MTRPRYRLAVPARMQFLIPLRARSTGNGPALQVRGSSPPGVWVILVASWRMVLACRGSHFWCKTSGHGAGTYNSPWGAHGHVFRGRIAHPQGVRGRVSSPPGVGVRDNALGGSLSGTMGVPPYPLRTRPTGYEPALQVRGRIAGAPTPDIYRAKRRLQA